MNKPSPDLPPSPQVFPALAAARARLARVEGYLQVDPGNETLLADAFETALRCSAWADATRYLASAQERFPHALPWALRAADLAMAQEHYAEAEAVLNGLGALEGTPPAFAAVVLHNLAAIDFARAEWRACVDRLAATMQAWQHPLADAKPFDPTDDPALWAALGKLWLRALHRTGDVVRAVEWTKALEAKGLLLPQQAGIASLAALDAEDIVSAQQWAQLAQHASDQEAVSLEAWVTLASLALAAQKPDNAHTLAQHALQLNPDDGRAWAVRAYADLLAGHPSSALAHFKRATHGMRGHIGTWIGRGWAELVLSDLVAAQTSFQTALDLDRNFAESHGGLAVVLVLQKRTAEAQAHVKLAQRLDPQNLSGRYAQALLNGELADIKAFERLAQNLLGHRKGLGNASMLAEVKRGAEKLRDGG